MNLKAEQLSDIFQQEIPLVQEFLSLLEQENQMLQNFRSEGLEDLVQQKNAILAQLQILEQQRISLLDLSLNDRIDQRTKNSKIIAITENLVQEIGNPDLITLWEILRELAKNVQDFNNKNGNLLGMHLNQTNEFLKILQQQEQPSLYGKQGFTCDNNGGIISDKA